MISLPPGCTVTYSVWVDVKKLTPEIVEWYEIIGGRTKESEHWDTRGRRQVTKFVAYGNGKWCHHHHNGMGGTRLHFNGTDASVASMCILKFLDQIDAHNLQEAMDRYEHDSV
jgi:hypothetical protein